MPTLNMSYLIDLTLPDLRRALQACTRDVNTARLAYHAVQPLVAELRRIARLSPEVAAKRAAELGDSDD